MPRFPVAIQHPDDYAPSLEGEEMIRDIHAPNEEMEAAGARHGRPSRPVECRSRCGSSSSAHGMGTMARNRTGDMP